MTFGDRAFMSSISHEALTFCQNHVTENVSIERLLVKEWCVFPLRTFGLLQLAWREVVADQLGLMVRARTAWECLDNLRRAGRECTP